MTMLAGLTTSGTLSLFDGVGETPVASVAPGRISLITEIARRTGRFVLIWQRGSDRIEIPLRGQVSADGRHVETSESPVAARLGDNSADVDHLEHALLRAAFEDDEPAAPAKRSTRIVVGVLLAMLCLALAAYDLSKLYHAAVTITPRVAFLATEVSTINSPTSGRLTFIAEPGEITTGEPVIGIENAGGKTILVDATTDAQVISRDHMIGDRVRRGDPLLAIADRDPPVYLSAILSREQAFDLTHGVIARYALLDGGPPSVTETFVPGEAFTLKALDGETRAGEAPLYQVRFKIDAKDVLTRGAPVYLEFQRTLGDSVGTGLTAAGLPQIAITTLLRPLSWLESIANPRTATP
jgi:hypothetical protein